MAVLATGILTPGQEAQPPANQKGSGSAAGGNADPRTGPTADSLTVKVNVNLVPMRLVVRDAHGQAVGNLRKEDFRILDKGKPQIISQFSVEKGVVEAGDEQERANGAAGPGRFVVYIFDDVHLQFGDLAHAREAFEHQVSSLRPTDRAGIVTTSGRTVLDFTSDRAKLRQVSELVRPTPTGGASGCLKMSYFVADQIQNKHNGMMLRALATDAAHCEIPTRSLPQTVSSIAQQELAIGQQEAHNILAALKNVVQSISTLPAQKIIILVSPGFIIPDLEFEYSELIDQALRSQVIVSTLDARGVYVVLPGESSEEKAANSQVLALLAEGTGGGYFRSNNDLNEGFRLLTEPPQYSYLLGFAPQDLKEDGKFHKLEVKGPKNATIQARPGYYAPKRAKEHSQPAK